MDDDDGLVVKRILRFADAAIEGCRSRLDLSRAFHSERFVRPFVVEFL